MPRPRDRQSTTGLLPRMEARTRKDGRITYRFHPLLADGTRGKPINLGTDKALAIRPGAGAAGHVRALPHPARRHAAGGAHCSRAGAHRPCPGGTPAPGGGQWAAVEQDGVMICNT